MSHEPKLAVPGMSVINRSVAFIRVYAFVSLFPSLLFVRLFGGHHAVDIFCATEIFE